MIRIKVASPQEIHPLPYQRLRDIGALVLEGEAVKEAKVSLAFVDNPTIHRINNQFLQHDEPTDVITFPMSGPGAKVLEGELVIGVEVAIEQARERGHSVDEELFLYVVHGLLHLVGFDDIGDADRAAMRARERYWLKELSLPDIADEG